MHNSIKLQRWAGTSNYVISSLYVFMNKVDKSRPCIMIHYKNLSPTALLYPEPNLDSQGQQELHSVHPSSFQL